MSEFEKQVVVAASGEKVWDSLVDIGNIYVWNPGVVHSEQTTKGDVGLGACRPCDLGGKNYLNEEVVEFERPYTLTMRITDTNLPFDTADIRFWVKSQGNDTLVTVSPKYQLKFGWFGRVLDAVIVRSQYRKGMRDLLRGLKEYIEQNVESSHID